MSKPRQYEVIVFDWDGTLMDSEAKIVNCICAAATDCALPVPARAAARSIIGLGLTEALQRLFPDRSEAERARLVDRYREHFLIKDRTSMPLFPGVVAGLERLAARGHLLAVATGKARRGLERVLDETGTRHLFAITRCADEAFSKPHPQMLHDILEHTGVEPARALMIGDTTFDMLMARNARVPGLAVSYGVHDRAVLLECGPLGCLDSFEDVCAWLG